jgi:hypothetical protein
VGHQEGLGVGTDLVNNAVVLTEDEVKLRVVVLELLFLEEHDLGRLWNVDSNSGQALGLTDEGQDLRVEVDVETVVVWMSDDQGSLETSLCLLDLKGPLLPPQVLVREQGVTNLVVLLDWALVVALLGELWWELLHWH